MPPTKVQTSTAASLNKRSSTTRAQNNNGVALGKRKADASPLKNEKVKRSALGNLTNAFLNYIEDSKKGSKQNDVQMQKQSTKTKTLGTQNIKPRASALETLFSAPKAVPAVPQRQAKVMTRAATRAAHQPSRSRFDDVENVKPKTAIKEISTTIVKTKKKTESATTGNNNNELKVESSRATTRRISNEFDLNENGEESHYMSALEDFSTSSTTLRLSVDSHDATTAVAGIRRTSTTSNSTEVNDTMYTLSNQSSSQSTISSTQDITISQDEPNTSDPPQVPDGVVDFDRENWDDPLQASHFAMDIFNYLKDREQLFKIDAYMVRQKCLTPWMRTLLVDWMVEVQETFELNHETLYLAVKIVDIYLSKVVVQKEKLQLLGAAALFMACKYDERTPPMIVDFLYICDGAYDQSELTRMEMNVFRTIDYDLGIPLSYRFLRRYARCAKVAMPELTLARYILESSLMNYDIISMSDSKIAAACLFMALRMNNKTGWNKTLEYYSGYKLSDFQSIIPMLNEWLHQKPRDANKTVRNKYAHKIFFEVSKVPLMTDAELLLDQQI